MRTIPKIFVGVPLAISTVIFLYFTIAFITVDIKVYWITGALSLIDLIGVITLSLYQEKPHAKNEEL